MDGPVMHFLRKKENFKTKQTSHLLFFFLHYLVHCFSLRQKLNISGAHFFLFLQTILSIDTTFFNFSFLKSFLTPFLQNSFSRPLPQFNTLL